MTIRFLNARSRTVAVRTAAVAAFFAGALAAPNASAAAPYTASWASVDTHNPAPEWFKDAKFGIYFHYGAFSVPAYHTEWYPRRMFDKSDAIYKWHLAKFGDPDTNWAYHTFIEGANDRSGKFVQFKPVLVSAGGKLDPDAMATLIVKAGARFAGPVMEHHDGFSMWDSKVNPWNSVAHGPKLNLAKLWTDAFRKKGLKIVATMHHAYNFNGYYEKVPPQTDPGLKIFYGQLSKTEGNQLWYDKLKEVIDEFQPDILWQDVHVNNIDQAHLLQFLSYYYNQAALWGREVVATYKDGFNNKGEVYDYEHGGPADITTPYWLTDDLIATKSWSYIEDQTYYSSTAILHSFFDRVSKGGNLLFNISPMADGSVPEAQQTILYAIGDWLGKFGEAIYATRTFAVYGEGPTKMGGGGPRPGKAEDVRYTTSKDGDAVYAIFLGWPGNGKQVTLTSVTAARFKLGATAKVYLLGQTPGTAASLTFSQTGAGLTVTLPATAPYNAPAYALKISLTGKQPGPPPPFDGGPTGTAGAGGTSSTGGAGNGSGGSDADDTGGLSGGTGGASAGAGDLPAGAGESSSAGTPSTSGGMGDVVSGNGGDAATTAGGGSGTPSTEPPPPASDGDDDSGGCALAAARTPAGERQQGAWLTLALLASVVNLSRRKKR